MLFPRLWVNLVLTLAAGFLQGLGLAFFVPVINLMNSESTGGGGRLFGMIEGALGFLGLPYSQNILLLMVATLISSSLLLTFFQQYFLYHSMMAYVSKQRDRLIKVFLNASWPHLAGQSSGETINKLLNESYRAGGGLVQLVMATTELATFAVFLGFGLMLSWKLLAFTLCIGAGGFLVLWPVRRLSVKTGQRQVATERAYTFQAVDYLGGTKLIKALGSQQQALNLVNDLQRHLRDSVMAKVVSVSSTELLSQMIPLFALTGIIYIGTSQLELEASTILIFVVYLVRMAPLMARFQQRYQSYLLERPTVDMLEESISTLACNGEQGLDSGVDFHHLNDQISLENVDYSFPSSDVPTLSNISFTISKGQLVAFVGSSGGGKSTILELLSGLRRPTSGKILIDGVDMEDMNITTWRQHIGYVGQDNIIFNDTVRKNLIFAHPDASEETIKAAIKTAHLDEMIRALPDGMETVLGENGVRFSGGQRQRLALARALIGEPDLLILDEATSALDTDSERLIQNAIDEISRHVSVVVVAHRLSTIRNADIVHVIEAGKIVESGTYDELITAGGRLNDLHEFQLK